MQKTIYVVVGGFLALLFSIQAVGLEVDREVIPRITLGGRVVTTLDAVSESDAEHGINLEDSSLMLRFDKRLYRRGVAGAVIGIKDDQSGVTFQQLHTFYWDHYFAFQLGRSRLRNSLIEFPLLRDDDFLDYTHVGNASSNEEFDQVYGDTISTDWIVDGKLQQLGLWAGTRFNGNELSFPNAANGFDSHGFTYVYEQAKDLLYVKRLRNAGIAWDRQRVEMATGGQWMNAIVFGAEVNLNINPVSNWSVATQLIYNFGIDGVEDFQSVAKRAGAESLSIVTSVRLTRRPMLLTRWQAALVLAYKNFSGFDNATQWSIAPNAVYRLGQGIDLLAQLNYTGYGNELDGGDDIVAQIGLVYSLEALFNDTIGERDSILNLEHGYIQ